MSKKESELVPVSSKTDTVLDLIALVSSATPLLGGPIGNFFGGISSGRKFARVREAIEGLVRELRNFKSEASEEYVKTEDFEELLEETLLRIAKERNEEKREIYRDFLVGAIKSPREPYDEQIRFLRTLEQLQPDHILVIRALLKDPDPDPGMMGSPIQTLSKRLPDMPQDRIEDLIAQLNDMRITSLTSLRTMMTGHGAQDLRHSITAYGQRFVRFIEA